MERAARELRAAVRTIVRAEGAGVPPGVAQREQLAFLLQQPGGEGSSRGSGSGGAAGNNKKGWQKGGKAAGSVVDAVGESKEVTRSLARTRELMSQELRRMGGVVDVIGAGVAWLLVNRWGATYCPPSHPHSLCPTTGPQHQQQHQQQRRTARRWWRRTWRTPALARPSTAPTPSCAASRSVSDHATKQASKPRGLSSNQIKSKGQVG